MNRHETVRLSRFSGAYEPDPTSPRKIERLDWPAPPHPAAVPELLSLTDRFFRRGKVSAESRQLSLKKIIEEITKIEKESSMAHAVLTDLKAKDRSRPPELKLDPWKASRSANAKVEPEKRTRFKSPVNASPSRIYRQPRSSASLQRSSNPFSPLPSTTDLGARATTSSGSFFVDSGIMSPTSPFSHHSLSSHLSPTSPVRSFTQPYHYHVQKPQDVPGPSVLNESYLNKTNYINSTNRIITLPSTRKPVKSSSIVYNMPVPKPGYGLSRQKRSMVLTSPGRQSRLQLARIADVDTPGTSGSFIGRSNGSMTTPSQIPYQAQDNRIRCPDPNLLVVHRAVLRYVS